jgi:hypothetical protein
MRRCDFLPRAQNLLAYTPPLAALLNQRIGIAEDFLRQTAHFPSCLRPIKPKQAFRFLP